MVSFNCFKLLRGVRSICLPVTTIVGMTLMLTYVFILYRPGRGPGLAQKMGWQSWEVINGTSLPTKLPTHHGVDWWNVTVPNDTVDYSSLPLDVWMPLLPHNTGCMFACASLCNLWLTLGTYLVSEITLTRCLVNPYFGDVCTPDSTIEQDAIKGKWVRVPRNLNWEGNYGSGWLVSIGPFASLC